VIVVTIKYFAIVMRTSHSGEGGIPVVLSMLMVLTMTIGYNRYGKQKMKNAISKVKL